MSLKLSLLAIHELLLVSIPGGAAPAPNEKVAVVTQLYQEFAWEALIGEPQLPGQELLEQPREALVRYFRG
ncbi:MAG: hypothetical protein ACSLFQ_09910 [Thermoanaerobaculia bacterium]